MNNNKPLWKNIGKQVFQESDESSIRSNRKPLKGFEIHFQAEQSENSEYDKHFDEHKIRKIESLPQNFTNKEDSVAYTRTPMIMTMDNDKNQQQDEEVLEAISFESDDPKQMKDLNVFLDSIKELQLRPTRQSKEVIKKQIKIQSFKTKNKLCQQLSKAYQFINEVKKEFNKQKIELLKSVCQWRISVAKDCQKMNEALCKCNSFNGKNSGMIIPDNGIPNMNNSMVNRLKQEIEQMKLNLSNEKLKTELFKKENEELKIKMRTTEIISHNKIQVDKYALQQDYKAKIKILENQLLSSITDRQNVQVKANKLKELVNQRENDLLRQSQENSINQKRIQDFKNNVEEAKNRQRKIEIQMKIQQEKYQQQKAYFQKQINKFKQETAKLKQLLKNSQEQLCQCENYINSIINQSKLQNQQSKKLSSRIRQLQVQHYKKLQIFDKALIEIENDIVEVSRNQQLKLVQIEKQSIQIEKQRQKLQYKEMKLNEKQYEIHQFKKQVEKQMELLQRKECAMKAEYMMAINAQNATKDRWYQRYYNTFSDQQERKKPINSLIFTNDTGSMAYPSRPYIPKNQCFQVPTRQTVPLISNYIRGVKSQTNIGIYSPTRDKPRQKNRKLQIQKSQTYRDYKICNKIETLRKELTKQITSISH